VKPSAQKKTGRERDWPEMDQAITKISKKNKYNNALIERASKEVGKKFNNLMSNTLQRFEVPTPRS